MTSSVRKSWEIARKDLRCEFRTLSSVMTMVLLGFLVVLVFSFSIEGSTQGAGSVQSGILWAAFLFPGLIAVGRSFEAEEEAQCLEGLLLCPVSRTAIYLGKLVAGFVLTFGNALVVLAFFTILYDVSLDARWLALAGVLLLASIGLAAIGTLFAAATTSARVRSPLLTILVLPLVVPMLVAAARCSIVLLGQQPWQELGMWPAFIALYDVLFLALGIAVFDFVVE